MDRSKTAGILDSFIEPLSRCLTPEAGRAVLELRANPVAQARIEELAEKSTEGQLTPEERGEYETYVLAGNLIAILQAKVRNRLAESSNH